MADEEVEVVIAVKIEQRHPEADVGADAHPWPVAGVVKDCDVLFDWLEENALEREPRLRLVQTPTLSAALAVGAVAMSKALCGGAGAGDRAASLACTVAVLSALNDGDAAVVHAPGVLIAAVGTGRRARIERPGVRCAPRVGSGDTSGIG